MARKIPLLAFGFGAVLANAQAFIHSSHSHGPALIDIEHQASEGVLADKDVQDRTPSDWEGVWQSVNPYLLNGDLDPVLEQKAKKPGGKNVEEYRAYYKKGYATDMEQTGIENDVIEFHVGGTVNNYKYHYLGYKTLHCASGKRDVCCLFEYQQGDASAPKFMQFNDHIIGLRKSQYFHIFMSNKSQETLLKEVGNWPTYYPYTPYKEQIVNEMLHR